MAFYQTRSSPLPLSQLLTILRYERKELIAVEKDYQELEQPEPNFLMAWKHGFNRIYQTCYEIQGISTPWF